MALAPLVGETVGIGEAERGVAEDAPFEGGVVVEEAVDAGGVAGEGIAEIGDPGQA